MLFCYGEQLLASCPNPKLEPCLLFVCHNLSTHHAVVTRDPLNKACCHWGLNILFGIFKLDTYNLCFFFLIFRVHFYSQIKQVTIVVLYILTFTFWDRRWGDSFLRVSESFLFSRKIVIPFALWWCLFYSLLHHNDTP